MQIDNEILLFQFKLVFFNLI